MFGVHLYSLLLVLLIYFIYVTRVFCSSNICLYICLKVREFSRCKNDVVTSLAQGNVHYTYDRLVLKVQVVTRTHVRVRCTLAYPSITVIHTIFQYLKI